MLRVPKPQQRDDADADAESAGDDDEVRESPPSSGVKQRRLEVARPECVTQEMLVDEALRSAASRSKPPRSPRDTMPTPVVPPLRPVSRTGTQRMGTLDEPRLLTPAMPASLIERVAIDAVAEPELEPGPPARADGAPPHALKSFVRPADVARPPESSSVVLKIVQGMRRVTVQSKTTAPPASVRPPRELRLPRGAPPQAEPPARGGLWLFGFAVVTLLVVVALLVSSFLGR